MRGIKKLVAAGLAAAVLLLASACSLSEFRVQIPGFYDPLDESGPIQV